MYLILEDGINIYTSEKKPTVKYKAMKRKKTHDCNLAIVKIIDCCEIKFEKSKYNEY